MIDVNKIFPYLKEVYTEEGVQDTFEVAKIIEKMCENITKEEIEKLMAFTDGGRYHQSYDMFYEVAQQKRH